jgi:hypothetical protein
MQSKMLVVDHFQDRFGVHQAETTMQSFFETDSPVHIQI